MNFNGVGQDWVDVVIDGYSVGKKRMLNLISIRSIKLDRFVKAYSIKKTIVLRLMVAVTCINKLIRRDKFHFSNATLLF